MVLSEFAIACPFVVMLAVGVLDIGRGLDSYLQLKQAVQAGVRFAGSVPNLTQGSFICLTPDQNCTQTGRDDSAHRTVQERVGEMLALQRHSMGQINYQIQSEYTANAGGGTEDVIAVRLEATLDTVVPLLKNVSVSVEATGPYLLEGET